MEKLARLHVADVDAVGEQVILQRLSIHDSSKVQRETHKSQSRKVAEWRHESRD